MSDQSGGVMLIAGLIVPLLALAYGYASLRGKCKWSQGKSHVVGALLYLLNIITGGAKLRSM
jgi:hypothetical protein